jgi:hypothetical protein
MPELLNLWYEQHAYHKILPSEFNLSMEISLPLADWVTSSSRFCIRRMCDNFLGIT